MSNVNASNAAAEAGNTVTATATVAAPAAPKAPSKKSQAQTIFSAKLVEYQQGLFGSKKDFRHAVLVGIEAALGVSRASASTMYNSFKKDAETAGTVTLGRDPKKEKAPSTGKRGRPAKAAAPAADGTAAVVAGGETAPVVAAEAVA